MFMSNREVPTTNNESEQALRMSAVFRKVTNGFRGSGARSCTEACGRWRPRAATKDSRYWPRCARRWRVTASSHRCQLRAPNDRSGEPASSPYSVPTAAFRR